MNRRSFIRSILAGTAMSTGLARGTLAVPILKPCSIGISDTLSKNWGEPNADIGCDIRRIVAHLSQETHRIPAEIESIYTANDVLFTLAHKQQEQIIHARNS